MHSPRVSWFKEWKTILGRNSKWRPFPRETRGHFGALFQKCLRVISPHKNRACHVCSGCPSLFCLYSIFGPKTRHMPLHLLHSVFMGRFKLIFGTVWHQNQFFMGRFRLLLGQCGIKMHFFWGDSDCCGDSVASKCIFMGRFRLLLGQCGIQMRFFWGDSDCCWDSVASKCILVAGSTTRPPSMT